MKSVCLAIVGSRSFNNYKYMEEGIEQLRLEYGINYGEIVSGGARGADSLAETLAQNQDVILTVFPAEWDKYGKSAGYKRNKKIVDYADVIVAFWDGKSKGTKHTIDLAVKKNKPVILFTDWTQNG